MKPLQSATFIAVFICQALAFVPFNRMIGKVQSRTFIRSPLELPYFKLRAVETAESYSFESNVGRVMDIIINSLYSNRDVFMRELVSNAADACDKKKFLCTVQSQPVPDMKIRVYSDGNKNTLTIEDTGIGMNKAELIENLGRIAESGTKKFAKFAELQKKEKNDDLTLIGQFGVGFYSGFLVADKIDVYSKGSEGKLTQWSASSSDLSKYSITSLDPATAEIEPLIGEDTGTRIVLHLKDDTEQYLDGEVLKVLLKKYSQFVNTPIELARNVTKMEEVPIPGALPDLNGTIPTRLASKRVLVWDTVNKEKPLWMRDPKECSKADYEEFYNITFAQKTYAGTMPIAHAHFEVEGTTDFKALIFVPSEIPYELSRDMFAPDARNLKLYVKRVFINDKFEDLVPRWLMFLQGVVDSDDLPLNVGREILQQSRSLRIIKQRLVKKSIEMFTDLANNNPEEYKRFYNNFGRYLKVGVIEDPTAREQLLPLLRFSSSHSKTGMTTLKEYVARMPADQKSIYYIVGESRAHADSSPAIEKLKKKGYEVLYLTDTVDELAMSQITEFGGKKVLDCAKEEVVKVDFSKEEQVEKEKVDEEFVNFRAWLQSLLGSKVSKVECSARLVDSPAALVVGEYGMSPNMERLMRAQAAAQKQEAELAEFEQKVGFNHAVLEINPHHTIIQHLKAIHDDAANRKVDIPQEAKDFALLVYQTAALSGGYGLDNLGEYGQHVVKLMSKIAKQ